MGRALGIAVLALLSAGAAYYVLSFPSVPSARVDIGMSYRLQYFLNAYGVKELPQANWVLPDSARVEGVPAISYTKQYCATTCLQMIASYYGQNLSIHSLNLITGFTYGAVLFRHGDKVFFIPYSDPFAGLKNASEYLGLRYRFVVTNNSDAFIEAIKHFIVEGVPVIVPVNAARLYSFSGFVPHFELVVGYDGDSFIIHEPVTPSPSMPKVVRFDSGVIAKANEDLMKAFGMLWKHGAAVYEPGGARSRSLMDALRNDGNLLRGFSFKGANYTIATGSYALEELAAAVEKGLINKDYLLAVMEMARVNRADDAAFIAEEFPCCLKVSAAAQLLENASRIYGEVVEIVRAAQAGWESRAASLIRSAARIERVAGMALVDASYSCRPE